MKYKCNVTGAVLEPQNAEVEAQLAKSEGYTALAEKLAKPAKPDKPEKPAKE